MTDPAAIQAYMAERAALGERRYGTQLRTHNGRDALRDAFEEAVDCLMYLTQNELQVGDAQAGRHAIGPMFVAPAASTIASFEGPSDDPRHLPVSPLRQSAELVRSIAAALIERDGQLPCGDSDRQPNPQSEATHG